MNNTENTNDQLKDEYYNQIWEVLYAEAKKICENQYASTTHPIQTQTLRKNPNLTKRCPAAEAFINAVIKLGLDVNCPEKILSAGEFGWHGTRTKEAIISISYENLKISLRKYGAEYAATFKNAYYSQQSFMGDTNSLLLFFILKDKNPYYSKNGEIFIIKNPSQNEMYMIPILIATFQNQTPIEIDYYKINKTAIKVN